MMVEMMTKQEEGSDHWLTPQDVAKMLDLHVKTVRRHLREGKLKGYRVAKYVWRIDPNDLPAYARQNSEPPPQAE